MKNREIYRVKLNIDDRDYLLDRLEAILHDNLCRERSEEIIDSFAKYFVTEKKSKIICVVGPSGCGKTTLCEVARIELNIPVLVSYTTRPMRDGEKNGREHWFVGVDKKPLEKDMLAYAKFGDYEYWAEVGQVPDDGGSILYVIDEDGLRLLKEKWGDRFDIETILIKRNEDLLINDVGEERVLRDRNRKKIDDEEYDAIILNDSSLVKFLKEGIEVIRILMRK